MSAQDALLKTHPSALAILEGLTQGASMFLDPTGAQIGDMIQGEEGIAYADLDLNQCVDPKQFHDVVGGYQRFDVFDLKVTRERLGAEMAFEPRDDSVTAESPTENNQRTEAAADEKQHVQSPGLGLRRKTEFNVAHGVGGLRMM